MARETLTLAKILELTQQYPLLVPDLSIEDLEQLWRVYQTNVLALATYIPKPCPLPTLLFQASQSEERSRRMIPWNTLIEADLIVHRVEGNHFSLLKEPDQVAQISKYLQKELNGLE